MPFPEDEPTTADAIATWVARRARVADLFGNVYEASEQHRLGHGGACTLYASGSGPLLGVLATVARPARILEVGCGIGYTALSLAHGAPAATVETIEADAAHAALARETIARAGYSHQVTVLEGAAADVLPGLAEAYDFIFCDADPDAYLVCLEHFLRLLAPGGLLVTSNLFLGQHGLDIPGLDQAAAYRDRIVAEPALHTAFLPSGLALSVRR